MAPTIMKIDSIFALEEFVSPVSGIEKRQQVDEQQLPKEVAAIADELTKQNGLSMGLLGREKIFVLDQGRVDRGNMHLARLIAAERAQQGKKEAFVVLNVDTVAQLYRQWCENMPRVKPFYAVKCNNDPVLIATLARLGAAFDCASREEIDLILDNGLASPDGIVYANTCKSAQFIRHAAARGISRFTFDCVEELAKMHREFTSAELILRINVTDPSAKRPLDVKFGCDPVSDAPRLLLAAKQLGMQIVGISFHVGSGCQNPLVYREAITMARKLFSFGQKLGHRMHVLDLGGGFPGCEEERQFFVEIAKVIDDALDEFFPEEMEMSDSLNFGSQEKLEIIAEPGRYFASSPTSVCANVIGATQVNLQKLTKRMEDEQGKAFMYYLDDGVYGSFSCISSRLFTKTPNGIPLFEKTKQKDGEFLSVVWGPTCDTRDQVEQLCLKPRVFPGDWLYYADMGAYTRVTATQFNGFSRPKDTFYVAGTQNWKSLTENSETKNGTF